MEGLTPRKFQSWVWGSVYIYGAREGKAPFGSLQIHLCCPLCLSSSTEHLTEYIQALFSLRQLTHALDHAPCIFYDSNKFAPLKKGGLARVWPFGEDVRLLHRRCSALYFNAVTMEILFLDNWPGKCGRKSPAIMADDKEAKLEQFSKNVVKLCEAGPADVQDKIQSHAKRFLVSST